MSGQPEATIDKALDEALQFNETDVKLGLHAVRMVLETGTRSTSNSGGDGRPSTGSGANTGFSTQPALSDAARVRLATNGLSRLVKRFHDSASDLLHIKVDSVIINFELGTTACRAHAKRSLDELIAGHNQETHRLGDELHRKLLAFLWAQGAEAYERQRYQEAATFYALAGR